MDATTHMVTLANGRQIDWNEFSNWSSKKQNNSILQIRLKLLLNETV